MTCAVQEAFGLTVLGAMAYGVPVVDFGVGGILDMVRSGIKGLSVPVADSEALAAGIRDVLGSNTRRMEMGANARRITVEEYSLELQARRYADLYRSVL